MAEQTKTKVHTAYKKADGTRVPSVTTILGILNKPALLDWAWRMGLEGLDYKEVRDQAADIGTLAHLMILNHLKGDKGDYSEYSKQDIDKAENCILSYFEWEKNRKIEPLMLEQTLVSEEYSFGGMVDFFGKIDSQPTLLDFKTGKAIYPEFFYQLAAYEHLLAEQGELIEITKILRIGRDADEGFEERAIGNLDKHWELFLNCLKIYNLQKEIRKEK